MTTSGQIRATVASQLTALLPKGTTVFSPRDWSSNSTIYPAVFVKLEREARESLGPNTAQEFETVATIKITARVQVAAQTNDAGAQQAEQELETLKQQIDQSLINNPAFVGMIEQILSIQSEINVNSEGAQHLGELVTRYDYKFYEGPEDFFNPSGVPIETITVDADLTNVYDATGTYPNPPFPQEVTPAPRTEGPDGRAEGGLDITLPQ